MIAAIRALSALMAGVALLMTGSGLLSSLIAMRGQAEGFGPQALGLITSAYFVGFLLGTYAAPGLIRRIGHIRAFAFYAQLCAAAVLLHPIWIDPWAWGLLRLLAGLALVGLCTVIESWLTTQATASQRGQVFAAYMAVNLGGLALGQVLLARSDPAAFGTFSLVAILVCLAGLPVTATRVAQPDLPATPRLGLARLYRMAPAAAGGVFLGGLAMGAFWGLTAVWATARGLAVSQVGSLLLAAIVGGALLQWPIGRLSDRGDRRSTLAALGAVAALLAAGWTVVPAVAPGGPTPWALLALAFAFGGAAFAIYPVCVAHLLDHVPTEDVLAGCSGLLLVNGIGAAIGPALAGAAMARLGPAALPGFFAATLAALALVAGGRRLWRRRDRDHPAQFHPMVRTTPSALGLLPDGQPPAHPTLHDEERQ